MPAWPGQEADELFLNYFYHTSRSRSDLQHAHAGCMLQVQRRQVFFYVLNTPTLHEYSPMYIIVHVCAA